MGAQNQRRCEALAGVAVLKNTPHSVAESLGENQELCGGPT